MRVIFKDTDFKIVNKFAIRSKKKLIGIGFHSPHTASYEHFIAVSKRREFFYVCNVIT